MRRAWPLLALLAACASAGDEPPPMVVSTSGGGMLRPSGDSFDVQVRPTEWGTWTLTVGYGGELAEEPRILLDGRKVELELGGPLAGFGQYSEVTYALAKPGNYRVELWEKPADERPRAVYFFTLKLRE